MIRDEWKLIYEMYYQPLYFYALSLSGNRQDAEDLVQETFVKAYLSYQSSGSVKCWLVTVLRNEFFNQKRKRKKELLDGGKYAGWQDQKKGDMLARIIEQEERRQLFVAIQELPLPMKEILMESIYFHMKDEEIASMHQISRENVRKIRSRAKQKLVKTMKEGE